MDIKNAIKKFADNHFTSPDKFTWYDRMWSLLSGDYTLERRKVRKISQIQATEYFTKNWDRVEKIKSWLYDQKSKEIYENLIRFAMTGDRKYHHGCDPNQYFPSDVITLSNDEVFIDCGGYIADTTLDFVNRVGGGINV